MWPPEPKTMRSFAEDFGGLGGWGVMEGRIHRNRRKINVDAVMATMVARDRIDWSDIREFD